MQLLQGKRIGRGHLRAQTSVAAFSATILPPFSSCRAPWVFFWKLQKPKPLSWRNLFHIPFSIAPTHRCEQIEKSAHLQPFQFIYPITYISSSHSSCASAKELDEIWSCLLLWLPATSKWKYFCLLLPLFVAFVQKMKNTQCFFIAGTRSLRWMQWQQSDGSVEGTNKKWIK